MPNQETPKQIEKLLGFFNADKIVSKEEMDELLSAIVTILSEHKKGTESVSAELRQEVKQLVEQIVSEHDRVINTVNQDTTTSRSEVERLVKEQNDRAFSRLQDLINKTKFPKDGKDADPEEVIRTVLERIKLPENKEFILTAEDVRGKIEELEDDDKDALFTLLGSKRLTDLEGSIEQRFADALNRIRLTRGVHSIIAGTNITVSQDGNGNVTVNSTGGGGGHTIEDEGTPLTQRTNLNFVGATVAVTDDSGNDATIVTISGGGGTAPGPTGATGATGSTGPQGTQGTQGTQGSIGVQGATGPTGNQGTQGSIGIQGTQGSQGSIGIQGPQGTQGSIGPAGGTAPGPTGATGATGPTGTQYPWQGAWTIGNSYAANDTVGNAGNGYIAIAASTATGSNNPTDGASASTFWNLLVQRGSQGSQGSQGTVGNQGTQGSIGVQGTQGTQGSLGPTGATGPQGTQGTAGSRGSQGSQGSQGTQGSVGATGGTGFVSPRSTATASTLSPTPNADTTDIFALTAQAGTAAFQATSGTPVEGQKLIVKIRGTGPTQNITWTGGTAGYTAGGVALPLTTVNFKVITVGFIYDTSNSINRWMCVAVATQV